MKSFPHQPVPQTQPGRAGKVKTGILLWALGVPIPFILLFVVIRSCV